MTNFSTSNLSTNDLNQERTPYIQHPYIGKARLIDVNNEEREYNGEKFTNLNFVFELAGDPEQKVARGTRYVYSEREPVQRDDEDSDTFQKRVMSLIKRVVYTMKYWIGDEAALAAANGNGWTGQNSFTQNVVNAMTETVDGKRVVKNANNIVDVKIVGAVSTTGRTIIGFPKYIGYIADKDSKFPLTFSKGELADNAAYEAALNAVPTNSNELAGTSANQGQLVF